MQTALADFIKDTPEGKEADPELKPERFWELSKPEAIKAKCLGKPGVVTEESKPSTQLSPLLYDLTSLQREAIRRFGWTARRTLSAAQRCYEAHKILTYPRTDSRCLPNDYRAKVREVLQTFADAGRDLRPSKDVAPIAEYGAAAQRLLSAGLENEARTFDDTKVSDHFAIIPTGRLPGPSVSGDDSKIFDLVARRFLGNFHPPAVWERVERTTVVVGERFRSRARTIMEPGWRSIGDAGTDEEGVSSLPPLIPGQSEAAGVDVVMTNVEAVAEQTKPPPRITEARLLSLMENAGKDLEDEDFAAAMHERGLGTPATRAEIIENLIAKGYAVRMGRAVRPTAKGIRLIDILRRIHIDRLTSAELTGEMEFHLNQVEHGQRPAADFMAEIEAYTREIVEHAKTFEYEELYANDAPLGPCPSCGRPVVEAPWFYRCQEQPERDPDCPLRIWKDTSGRYIDRNSAKTLVLEGKTGALEGFTARNGRTYQALLEIDREAWQVKVRPVAWEEGMVREDPEYEVDTEPVGVCPFEEECHVVESPTQFICERKLKETDLGEGVERPKSCGFVLPRTVCKREITREEAIYYVANKRTELLTDFTSRYGRPFSAMLVLKETGRHGFEFLPRAPRAAAAPAAEGDAAGAAPKRPARARKRAKAEVAEAAAPAARKPARKRAAKPRKTARKPKTSEKND